MAGTNQARHAFPALEAAWPAKTKVLVWAVTPLELGQSICVTFTSVFLAAVADRDTTSTVPTAGLSASSANLLAAPVPTLLSAWVALAGSTTSAVASLYVLLDTTLQLITRRACCATLIAWNAQWPAATALLVRLPSTLRMVVVYLPAEKDTISITISISALLASSPASTVPQLLPASLASTQPTYSIKGNASWAALAAPTTPTRLARTALRPASPANSTRPHRPSSAAVAFQGCSWA